MSTTHDQRLLEAPAGVNESFGGGGIVGNRPPSLRQDGAPGERSSNINAVLLRLGEDRKKVRHL
jgi:hypothetical protein